jgi:photosystem II stability/assembly factor-like uncharacterized protein
MPSVRGCVVVLSVWIAGATGAGPMDAGGHRAPIPVTPEARAQGDAHAPRGTTGWAALGPFGGDAYAIAISPTNPSVALCGVAPSGSSGGSLFRSTDRGASWAEVADLAGTSVYDAEFLPNGDALIGTIDGVWLSSNDGIDWVRRDLGIGLNQQVFDIEIDPADASVIWVGVADAIGSQPANVMKSVNGGLTWSDVTPPMPPMSANSIVVSPGNSDNVIVAFGGGLGGGAVWVTDDAGATWTNRSAGLPNNPMNAAAHNGSTIYIGGGQAFGSQFVGLYASGNNGATWSPVHDANWPQLIVRGIVMDPAEPEVMLVAAEPGIHRSVDGGFSWQVSVDGTASVTANALAYEPGSARDILAAVNGQAVLASDDAGRSFDRSATGIGALNVVAVAGDPNDSDRVAIAFEGLNDGGVFSSDDGGQTWQAEPVPPTRWSAVGYDADGTLHAISSGPTSIAPEGLYRRGGDGSWTGLGPDQGGLFESDLVGMLFGEQPGGALFLVGSDFGVAGTEATIWRSADDGATWTKVVERDPGDARDFVDALFVPGTGESQLVAAYDDLGSPQTGGAMRSADNGLTWTDANSGLSPAFRPRALAAANGEVFLAASQASGGTDSGLWATGNGGATWSQRNASGPMTGVVADPASPSTLYVSRFAAPKVLRSQDAGATFEPFADGLESAGSTRDFAVSGGGTPSLLFASGTGTYARTVPAGCGPADLVPPFGVLDLADIQAFVVAFLALDGAADLAPPFGVWDLADLQSFVIALGAGCP